MIAGRPRRAAVDRSILPRVGRRVVTGLVEAGVLTEAELTALERSVRAQSAARRRNAYRLLTTIH